MISGLKEKAVVIGALFILFVAAVLFRPLLPIDETRYMTVAWEMNLNHSYILPTLNFQPYHHKPPVLFWLINAAWSVTGISRTAGLIPIFAASALMIFLSGQLARRLFPGRAIAKKAPFLMLGSVPFLIYGTLVMFDVLMTVFVLSIFLFFLSYAQKRNAFKIIAAGILLGISVLTKGPVAYLYVLPPLLLAPLWMEKNKGSRLSWYAGLGGAIVVSAIPVLSWLYPVVKGTSSEFSFWLIWNQTAGRITGNFSSSHARPVYFFLPLLPVLFMPWLFFPEFWRSMKSIKSKINQESGIRFLLCWTGPVFIAFSLIAGKQPHYLFPLLPGAVIMTAILLENTAVKKIYATAATLIFFVCVGQAVASKTIFTNYDLGPVSRYIAAHPEAEWGMTQKNHGEMGFLARMTKPMMDIPPRELTAWLAADPARRAIIRFKEGDKIATRYNLVLSQPYRGKSLGVFAAKPPHGTNNEP